MQKAKFRLIMLLNLLLAVFIILVSACTVLPEEGTIDETVTEEEQLPLPKTLTDPDEIELFTLIQKAAQGREDVLAFLIYRVTIDHVEYSKDNSLALVWIALVDKETGLVQPGEPGLVIARRTEDPANTWQITFQADKDFMEVLNTVPDSLLSPEDKEHYAPGAQQVQKAGKVYSGYHLPWTNGTTVRVSGSIGHVFTYKSCPSTCLYAFDFANGTMFPVRAARRGTVKYAVWKHENGNPTKANYLVLEDTSTTPTTYQVYLHLAQNSIPVALRKVGAPVVQGQFIGNADDTGYSTGNHLHFHVHTNPDSYWGTSVDIVFDEVKINGGRPRTCTEAAAYPQYGSQCVEGNRLVSANSDAETPIGGISDPLSDSVVTTPTLNVSGWMLDDVKVLNGQLMIKTIGDWTPIGIPQTTSPFTTEINLCEAKIPNGRFSLSVVVQDEAGKISEGTQGLVELSKDYKCPSPPPVCVPTEEQVALYSETDFQGSCQLLEMGKYTDLNNQELVKADLAKSIMVGVDVSALVFADPAFGGTVELFQNGDSDLADNTIGADNAASIKVVSRLQPPVPPVITLPTMINTDTDLTVNWTREEDVETSATITGPGEFLQSIGWQNGGIWQLGKLEIGEYTISIEARNLAGTTTVSQQFNVVAAVVPPSSHMEALPQITNSTAVQLKWVVDSGEADVDHFNLQWKKGSGDWQNWEGTLDSKTRSVMFWAVAEKNYEFRIRAVDAVGTREAFPDTAEAATYINAGCSDDEYEGVDSGDDKLSTAPLVEMNTSQLHSWCPVGDVDWVMFEAEQGDEIRLTIKPLGLGAEPVIQLYDTDGTTLISEGRLTPADSDGELQWVVPLAGTYYVKLFPADERIGGVDATYEFGIERKSNISPVGLVCGSVSIPVLLFGGYTAKKAIQKKKPKGVGWK